MNDADLDLERRLRAHFRDARAEDPTPSALRTAVLGIPKVAVLDGARRRRLRGLTLLAATIALGAGAAGWALLAGAPSPAKPRPFPPAVAVVPTSSIGPSPSAEPESSPTSSAAPDGTRPVVVTEGDGQGAGATWQAAGTLATARYLTPPRGSRTAGCSSPVAWGPTARRSRRQSSGIPRLGRSRRRAASRRRGIAHAATLLHDGRVLIVGGAGRRGSTVDRAEIWDPATGAFEATSVPIRAQGVTATTLQDGRVLIVGGPVCQVDKWPPLPARPHDATATCVRPGSGAPTGRSWRVPS